MSPGIIFWIIETCLTNLESSEYLLFAYLNDFSLKLTDFTRYSQMQVSFFVQIIFYKNRIFGKNIFLFNHTSWGYFLDCMSLPYHFGKLWMSTFHWFQWFFTKAKRIHTILTNTSKLFFGPDLTMISGIFLSNWFEIYFLCNIKLLFSNMCLGVIKRYLNLSLFKILALKLISQ